MAFISPGTNLYLTCQPLDRAHKHVLYQDPSEWATTSHVGSFGSLHLTDQQYTQVGKGVIRCDVSSISSDSGDLGQIEDHPFNYLYFTNPGGQRVCAFIIDAKHINNRMVEYTYELDPIATYYPQSFNDNFGQVIKSSAPGQSSRPVGQPFDAMLNGVRRRRKLDSVYTGDIMLTLITSAHPQPQQDHSDLYPLTRYGQFYSAFSYIQFPMNADGLANMQHQLGLYQNYGTTDRIISLTLCPRLDTQGKAYYSITFPEGSGLYDSLHWDDLNSPGGVKTFTPDYPVLLNYPYHYIEVVDHVTGTSHKYQFQSFANGVSFALVASAFPQPSAMIAPEYYESCNHTYNFDKGFSFPLPQIPYTVSQFDRWAALNQDLLNTQKNSNAFSSAFSVVGGLAAAVGGAYTGNVPIALSGLGTAVGGIFGGTQGEQSAEAQIKQAEMLAPQIGGGVGYAAWSFPDEPYSGSTILAIPQIYEVVANPSVLMWANNFYMKNYGANLEGGSYSVGGQISAAQGAGHRRVFVQTSNFYPRFVASSFSAREQIAAVFNGGTYIHFDIDNF